MSASPLAAFQSGFAAALAARDAGECPKELDGDAALRFRIHRNNYFHGLSQELAAAYPVARQLVGDPFFFAMAREYLAAHAPRTRSLALFGQDLPDFLRRFPPAASLPYLPDLALLERARLQALHAADAVPLVSTELGQLHDGLAAARFVRHPATRIVTSDYPVLDIWQAHQLATEPVAGHFDTGARGTLITRPALDVVVQPLSSAEASFAGSLLSGDDVTTAVEQALGTADAFDLTTAFRTLLSAGAFVAVGDPDLNQTATKKRNSPC